MRVYTDAYKRRVAGEYIRLRNRDVERELRELSEDYGVAPAVIERWAAEMYGERYIEYIGYYRCGTLWHKVRYREGDSLRSWCGQIVALKGVDTAKTADRLSRCKRCEKRSGR